MGTDTVNAIRSVYGLDHTAAWLKNQIESGKTFLLLDEQRANTTLYPYGYKASRKDGIRSLEESISQTGEESKPNLSMKSKDYLAEIAHKDEMIQHLRDQMKRTKGVKTDAGTVTRQAKAIAREYATEYDAGELGRHDDGLKNDTL